jgi:hypothetical protein
MNCVCFCPIIVARVEKKERYHQLYQGVHTQGLQRGEGERRDEMLIIILIAEKLSEGVAGMSGSVFRG